MSACCLAVTTGGICNGGCQCALLRQGTAGAMAPELPPLLARLAVHGEAMHVDNWQTMMGQGHQMGGTVLGQAAARIAEAPRRGCQCLSTYCALFQGQ